MIVEESTSEGCYTRSGEYRIVSLRRERYLSIFVCIFSMALIVANYTSLRVIHIGDILLPGSFLFFPLVFACTDIINELYGYARVRRVIYSGFAGMLLMAVLMQLNLCFSGTMYNVNGEDDALFRNFLQYTPLILVLKGVSLLVADSANAYLFQRIKKYMYGRALWLRVLTSTFISQSIYSSVNGLLLYWFGPSHFNNFNCDTITMLFSGHGVKMLYAVATLPLVYFAVRYVERKDQNVVIQEKPLAVLGA